MRYAYSVHVVLAGILVLPPQPTTDWPALTQKPYADAKIPDLGLKPILVKPIDKDAWPERRKELADAWQAKLGPFPKKPKSLDVKIEETEKCDGYTRQ
jgi:hypothetical protein